MTATPAADDAATGPSLVFDEKAQAHSVAEDVLGILTGTFLVSLGLHLLHAAHAVTGGTAGLSLLLGYATAWPFWLLFAVINVPFALLASIFHRLAGSLCSASLPGLWC
ncbi:YitT family protein [Microbacterium sp.]|uniref:YitT family protein n=1 Tax=Microbacterium sp. TaxID=51671 RepID=UPI003C7834B9